MFPWGALIGLAGGQAVSGVLSTINNRNIQQSSDAEAARQKAYYYAKANENPLSRSEVQHVLGQYDRAAQQQIDNARGVAAIKGSTPEFAAAVQKGVAEGRANLMGNVAAGASARKDRYEQLGEMAQHQKALEDQKRRYERNQTYAALAANAASAVGSIMDGYSAKTPKTDTQQADTTQTTQPQATTQQQKLATNGAALPGSQQPMQRYTPQQTTLPHNLPQYKMNPETGKMEVVSGGPNFEYDTETGKVVLR